MGRPTLALNTTLHAQLLDHLDIDLPGSEREELFARFDVSGDKSVGFAEFEAAWHHIQKIVVGRLGRWARGVQFSGSPLRAWEGRGAFCGG